ncbi:MAG: MopE-related protein [Myxococcota bacterium]|nr:MopE-related protein [Myxococcota bacterium]
MTPHANQLRQGFLVAMGLSALSLVILPGCKPKDMDKDGFVLAEDCDDSNAAIHPEAQEICDAIDNNCDGVVDSDATDRSIWYTDQDADGHGDPGLTSLACKAPENTVANNTDCNPAEATAHPGAKEDHTDRIDNDCDGMVDEMTCPEATTPKSAKRVLATQGKKPLMFCTDTPEEGQSCPSPTELNAQQMVQNAVGRPPGSLLTNDGSYSMTWWVTDPICGPDETQPDSCCYVFQVGSKGFGLAGGPTSADKFFQGDVVGISERAAQPVHGRPLTVAGTPRVAPSHTNRDWFEIVEIDLRALTPAQRAQLAAAWQQAGLYEHASVASFARFALELMALQAPPELLLAATRAQADEVLHARACFSMASAFSNVHLGPGNLDLKGVMNHEVTAEQVLVQTILEGCINETLAASEADWLSEQADFPPIRRIQKQIAEDESRHAALGWKTVRWILQQHPELVDSARDAFAEGRRRLLGLPANNTDDAWMAPYGCMPEMERTRLAAEVWNQVIEPCAQALLLATEKQAHANPSPQQRPTA